MQIETTRSDEDKARAPKGSLREVLEWQESTLHFAWVRAQQALTRLDESEGIDPDGPGGWRTPRGALRNAN